MWEEEDNPLGVQERQKDKDKVSWVREVLHKNKHTVDSTQNAVNESDRTVSDETNSNALKGNECLILSW